MTEVQMPRLSESMEEGTVLVWLKRDGERVSVGDELVEIETDKATVTVRAEVAGVVRIIAAEGESLRVGAPIAAVEEHVEGHVEEPASEDHGAEPPAAPTSEPPAAPTSDSAAGNGAEPERAPFPQPAPTTSGSPAPTPLARRAARVHGVLSGTGPRGRVTRSDVLHAAGVRSPQTERPPRASPPPPATTGVRPTRIQQRIAERMTESRTTIPEFEVTTEVTMDGALSARDALRELAANTLTPSINDLIIKACALALRHHPDVNAHYVSDALAPQPEVNIGIAVALPDALIVPVVHHADTVKLGAITETTRRLAERVRAGTVTPDELTGATFTISNLGMYGMTAIRPVIDPPQVAILGVGAVRQTIARVDRELVDRSLMTLTLSADHRALYGAAAAEFLADVRSLLETPSECCSETRAG